MLLKKNIIYLSCLLLSLSLKGQKMYRDEFIRDFIPVSGVVSSLPNYKKNIFVLNLEKERIKSLAIKSMTIDEEFTILFNHKGEVISAGDYDIYRNKDITIIEAAFSNIFIFKNDFLTYYLDFIWDKDTVYVIKYIYNAENQLLTLKNGVIEKDSLSNFLLKIKQNKEVNLLPCKSRYIQLNCEYRNNKLYKREYLELRWNPYCEPPDTNYLYEEFDTVTGHHKYMKQRTNMCLSREIIEYDFKFPLVFETYKRYSGDELTTYLDTTYLNEDTLAIKNRTDSFVYKKVNNQYFFQQRIHSNGASDFVYYNKDMLIVKNKPCRKHLEEEIEYKYYWYKFLKRKKFIPENGIYLY